MQTGSKQLLLIAGTLALSIALYFAPHKISETGVEAKSPEKFSFSSMLDQAKKGLKRQELLPVENLEKALSGDENNTRLLDSLGHIWDSAQQPAISAFYFEKIAEVTNGEKDWLNAAYRYFDAFQMTDDSIVRTAMVSKAVDSYKRVLEIDSTNLDAKTDLGLCYAEGSGNPMQGIKLLKEVVAENPEHENAQFNLGILSVRSGQLDKAIERFEKVLQINPGKYEARYLLAQTYARLGDKEKARENLEILKKQTSNPQLMQEVNSLMTQLNN